MRTAITISILAMFIWTTTCEANCLALLSQENGTRTEKVRQAYITLITKSGRELLSEETLKSLVSAGKTDPNALFTLSSNENSQLALLQDGLNQLRSYAISNSVDLAALQNELLHDLKVELALRQDETVNTQATVEKRALLPELLGSDFHPGATNHELKFNPLVSEDGSQIILSNNLWQYSWRQKNPKHFQRFFDLLNEEATLSTDGQFYAAALNSSKNGQSVTRELVITNPATGAVIQKIPGFSKTPIKEFKFLEKTHLIAIRSESEFAIWDVDQKIWIERRDVTNVHSILATNQGPVLLRRESYYFVFEDILTGKSIWDSSGYYGPNSDLHLEILKAVISADRRYLVFNGLATGASQPETNFLNIIDLVDRSRFIDPVFLRPSHTPLLDAQFSDDNKTVLIMRGTGQSNSYIESFNVYDLEHNRVLANKSITGSSDKIVGARISPDGKTLVYCQETTRPNPLEAVVSSFDTKNGAIHKLNGHGTFALPTPFKFEIRFSSEDRRMVLVSSDGWIRHLEY